MVVYNPHLAPTSARSAFGGSGRRLQKRLNCDLFDCHDWYDYTGAEIKKITLIIGITVQTK